MMSELFQKNDHLRVRSPHIFFGYAHAFHKMHACACRSDGQNRATNLITCIPGGIFWHAHACNTNSVPTPHLVARACTCMQ